MSELIIKEAPNIIPVLTDPENLKVNIALAIITFGAVLVALFQEKIKNYWNKAHLKMNINLSPPDSHQIELTTPDGIAIGNAIYIRIKVEHLKGKASENTEIILSNFWRIDEKGVREKMTNFLPMNLVWSHFQPKTHLVRVPKSLFRHCDFGNFRNTQKGVKLVLDTIVQPNRVVGGKYPNIIDPGKYEFELSLGGDNVKPIKKIWGLEFDRDWSENEDEMLSKHIKIIEKSF